MFGGDGTMRIKTPHGATINTKNGTVRLTWNPSFTDIWEGRFTEAQKYVDSAVLRYNSRYIPFRTGFLDRSGTLGTVIGSGLVVYNAPYARYMYYGKVMRDKNGRALYGMAPKHVTNEPIQYHGAPQRGAFWFEKMKAAHKDTILRGAAKRMR